MKKNKEFAYIVGFDADVDKVAFGCTDVKNKRVLFTGEEDVLDLQKVLLESLKTTGLANNIGEVLFRVEIPSKRTAWGAAKYRSKQKRKATTLPKGSKFNAVAVKQFFAPGGGGSSVAEEKSEAGTMWDSGRCYEVSQQIKRVLFRLGVMGNNIEEVLSHDRMKMQGSKQFSGLSSKEMLSEMRVLLMNKNNSKIFPSKCTQEQCKFFYNVKVNENVRDALFLSFPEILLQCVCNANEK